MAIPQVVLLVLLLAHSCHSNDTVPPYRGSQLRLLQLQQDGIKQEDTAGLEQPVVQPASSTAAAHTAIAAATPQPLLDATTRLPAAADVASISAASQQDANSALQTLLQAQLSMPEEVLALGFKPLASLALRNWRRLAGRLSMPGANMTVAAFGSQITMGHQGDSPNGSWVEELQSWLQVRAAGVAMQPVFFGEADGADC
jgi:hypothetical protein